MSEAAGKVLIVDDDPSIRRLLAALLKSEYELDEAGCGEEAVERAGSFRPHLVLLDIMLPGIDGHETCRRIKAGPRAESIQVVMVSANSSRAEQVEAYQAGADDYLVKPIDPNTLRARVRLHFQLQHALANAASVRAEIETHHQELKHLAEQRTRELLATQDVAVFALAQLAESRDQETVGHLERMRAYAQIIAQQLRRHGPYSEWIDQRFLDELYRSSPLHDIGKVGICDAILLKPARLTPNEFIEMEKHTVIGANILDRAILHSPGGSFLAMAAVIARFHHERFDGTGYPAVLDGEEIPLPARIVSVADVYDALTSKRPYKPAFPAADAREIILSESGRQFDPVVVDAFRRRFGEFLRTQQRINASEPEAVGALSFRDENLLSVLA